MLIPETDAHRTSDRSARVRVRQPQDERTILLFIIIITTDAEGEASDESLL
jgi:hypothetical protein